MDERDRITRRATLAGLAATLGAGGLGAGGLGCHGKAGAEQRPQRHADATASSTTTTTAAAAQIVKRLRSVSAIDGDGATVQRVFPTAQMRNLDPFVLLDDFNVREPAGFPEHPHRGFEAFTYMLQGAFHHQDTMGNDSVVSAGGVQRFNSGRYARHSEMPATKGDNRGLQLWVNLPRADKTMDPEYQGVQTDAMPIAEQDGLLVHTVAGGTSPVALRTEVDYLDVTLLSDREFFRVVPAGRNTLVYVLSDAITIRGERVPRGSGVLVGPGELPITGPAGARFAYLSGQPHGEPIRHRGPFVD